MSIPLDGWVLLLLAAVFGLALWLLAKPTRGLKPTEHWDSDYPEVDDEKKDET